MNKREVKYLVLHCTAGPATQTTKAIKDYLHSIEHSNSISENSAIDEIKEETEISKRSILDQITFENYSYYLGFDKL